MTRQTHKAPRPGPIERFAGFTRKTVAICAVLAACQHRGFAQPAGVIDAHDPSTVIQNGGVSYYYATGQGIVSRASTDRINSSGGPSVFSTPPAWTTTAVPGFTGFFWAPDIVFRNNQFYLYYSVSTFGSKISAIGLATSPTLNPAAPGYGWTDQGAVIQSNNGTNFNAIDPSILQDATGRLWMSHGSFNAGIFVTELDPITGKRLAGAPTVNVANHFQIEGSALIQHSDYYYLMTNWGGCCSGIDSGYEIHTGRSASPTGPFVDRNGVNLVNGGGTLFYDDDGARYGPGHFALSTTGGQDQFSYHYYDGNRDGIRRSGSAISIGPPMNGPASRRSIPTGPAPPRPIGRKPPTGATGWSPTPWVRWPILAQTHSFVMPSASMAHGLSAESIFVAPPPTPSARIPAHPLRSRKWRATRQRPSTSPPEATPSLRQSAPSTTWASTSRRHAVRSRSTEPWLALNFKSTATAD